ncbi:metal ABC transporter ATP-binding protein [Succinivibrio dextrinosolvens]|uniref:metal ABC transporter ATP-binding protein n=1 Tax=Succinivibrio dextrinosolvens TaxID=83771 RepID=UPI0004E2216D|nr:metal ABC transporter ATP-binding protein [Succinivibrio dextrinosolvens]
MTILNVNNLSVKFDNSQVLKDITFNLSKGQYLAVVGPNGAGKSTLVKTLVHENKRYEGSFSFDKTVKTTGYVAQQNNDGSYFPATAREIIISGLCRHHLLPFVSKADKVRINTVIEELELEDLLDKGYFNLSGGQKRAVLIARAFVASDKLLILDEPTAGLDVTSQSRLYNSIRKLNDKYSTSILMISHDLERIVKEADSVLCIEHELKFFGKTEDFIKTDTYKSLMEHHV